MGGFCARIKNCDNRSVSIYDWYLPQFWHINGLQSPLFTISGFGSIVCIVCARRYDVIRFCILYIVKCFQLLYNVFHRMGGVKFQYIQLRNVFLGRFFSLGNKLLALLNLFTCEGHYRLNFYNTYLF